MVEEVCHVMTVSYSKLGLSRLQCRNEERHSNMKLQRVIILDFVLTARCVTDVRKSWQDGRHDAFFGSRSTLASSYAPICTKVTHLSNVIPSFLLIFFVASHKALADRLQPSSGPS